MDFTNICFRQIQIEKKVHKNVACFIDPTNNQDYTVEATTTLNKKINGDGLLEVRLFETKENADFINKVGKLWWVSNVEGNGDKRKYVIISINKNSKQKPTISIVAREKFTTT